MAVAASSLLVAALATLVVGLVAAAGLALTRGIGGIRMTLAAGNGHSTAVVAAGGESRTGWRLVAHASVVLAFGMLILGLAARTLATGHAPWANLHEFSASFGAGVLGSYLALERRQPIRGLAPIVALVTIGLLAFAIRLDDRIDPLVPALQQPLLLTIHVGAAVLAYAISAVAFAAAIGELVQRRAADAVRALPSAAICRALAHRSVILAFPILTLAIVLGSVWANLAWRSYWSNDPKELAAAATWLVYAGYLHAAGRRDRWQAAAPWLLVLGFGGVLFTYIGAGLFFVGEHSYAAP
jgi:cytochrome c-type biogenesis protein CcsB